MHGLSLVHPPSSNFEWKVNGAVVGTGDYAVNDTYEYLTIENLNLSGTTAMALVAGKINLNFHSICGYFALIIESLLPYYFNMRKDLRG